ncbi:hypothetical protein OCV70_15425, partial [Blautia acetigignens]|uniref:hypothetical protein n=1 Tax=Blautia acetigignens TaxID=2981783 RepID=UPI0021D3AE13
IMMPPFIVFPTNRIAHFVEVSLYLFYLAQQVNLLLFNISRRLDFPLPSMPNKQISFPLIS